MTNDPIVIVGAARTPMGGFQAIMVAPDTGVYRAGSDHRKDGQAVGY